MASPHILFVHLHLAMFFAIATSAAAHNITNILSPLPQYSQFNSFLTQTKLANDINSRQTVTVLVLAGPAAAALSSMSLSDLRTALSLLVLVDYLDPRKLPDGSATFTTLYQTSGNAHGFEGLVKVSLMSGGIGFVSAATLPAVLRAATLVRAIELIPSSISVIEISAPTFFPPYILASSPPTVNLSNLTAILEKAGCGMFVSLIAKTGVMKTYEDSSSKGITVFAPVDNAFTDANAPDLSKLNGTDTVELLLYHALPQYVPFETLKSSAGRSFTTLATSGTSKYELSVTASGDQVTIKAGASTAKVGVIIVDSALVVIYVVDQFLLPVELSGKLVPTHAPAPPLPPKAVPPPSFSPPPAPPPPPPPPPPPLSPPPPRPPPTLPPVHGPSPSHSPSAAPSGKNNTSAPLTPPVPAAESPSSRSHPGPPPPVPNRTSSYAGKGRRVSWEALAAATAFSLWWVMG